MRVELSLIKLLTTLFETISNLTFVLISIEFGTTLFELPFNQNRET